ncbi:MAG: cupin domain-containing protein [Sphaerochaeta sp.]
MKTIEYMEFPTGRRTRVMIGQNGSIPGEQFCQGYVEIFPGGSIPMHNHETVESYTILEGTGQMTIDDETKIMQEGDFVFIEKNKHHSLVNIGEKNLYLMFVYAPQVIVDHWAQEQAGNDNL